MVEENNEVEEVEVQETEEVEVNDVPDTPPETKTVERKDKKVEVIPKITGKKYIADGWYELEKDKPKKVPKHVARLMRQSRIVYL